jgi:isoleucyl-tRNA synthetase
MTTKLEDMYDNIKEVSQLLRKVPNFNGQQFWQPIKTELNKLDIQFNNWIELSKFHKNLINIEEYDKYNKIVEINHFIRQHANIPINDKPNLTKIIQIALNSGQFLGSAAEDDIKKYKYNENKLGNITTYMQEEDIQNVSDKIPDQAIDNIKKYLDDQLINYSIL